METRFYAALGVPSVRVRAGGCRLRTGQQAYGDLRRGTRLRQPIYALAAGEVKSEYFERFRQAKGEQCGTRSTAMYSFHRWATHRRTNTPTPGLECQSAGRSRHKRIKFPRRRGRTVAQRREPLPNHVATMLPFPLDFSRSGSSIAREAAPTERAACIVGKYDAALHRRVRLVRLAAVLENVALLRAVT